MVQRNRSHTRRVAGGYASSGYVEAETDDLAELIGESVTIDDSGCWLFGGLIDANGYGQVSCGGRTMGAHRALMAILLGPSRLKGMHVHHVCMVKSCVNPAHLIVCTPSVHKQIHAGTFDADDWIVDRYNRGRLVESYKPRSDDFLRSA